MSSVNDVHGEADGGDDQHRHAQHLDRLEHALDGLEADHRRDEEQGEAIGECGQNLETIKAVGALPVGGAPGDTHRQVGEREGGRVGQHVAGIGEQRQRAGDDAAGRFGDQRHGRQQAGQQQPALVLLAAPVRMSRTVAVSGAVTVTVSHAFSSTVPYSISGPEQRRPPLRGSFANIA